MEKCLEQGDVQSVLEFMQRRLEGKARRQPGAKPLGYVSIKAIRESGLKRSLIKMLAVAWRPYAQKVSRKAIPRLPEEDWSDDEVCCLYTFCNICILSVH